MITNRLSKISFAPSADFARHIRHRVLNEEAAVVRDMDREALDLFLLSLGEVVKQHDGNDLFDVKPSESLSSIYHSRTMGAVPAHTDGHDMPIPPKFFLLFCVQPSPRNDGMTEISSVSALLESLTEAEQEIITKHNFNFETKPSKFVMGGAKVKAQILDKQTGIFRYSYNYLSKNNNKEINDLIEKIKFHHESNKKSVLLAKGDLLICDNHRVMHSRTEFSGDRRHLIRAWVN